VFLLVLSSNGCWSGFHTDLLPRSLRHWGSSLLRARTLKVNENMLGDENSDNHEHDFTKIQEIHLSLALFLLVFLQGVLLWSLALQLVRDWEYHSERWSRFSLLCRTQKSCFHRTKTARLNSMHLNTVSNIRAWIRLRGYLRDVKGKLTLELLRFCWMLFLPLLIWGLLDMFLDVTLSRSGHSISVSYWYVFPRLLFYVFFCYAYTHTHTHNKYRRIDRTFDTMMAWWCIYRIFVTGERISTAMRSHSWVISGERLQIEFDLSHDNVADKIELKRANACMKQAADFLHLAGIKERLTLLSFQLDRSTLDALLKFLYGYAVLLIAVFVQDFAEVRPSS